MVKKLLLLVIFLGSFCAVAETNPIVNVYYEYSPDGVDFFADNDEMCPVTISLEYRLWNLKPENQSNKVFVVPPQSWRFKLTSLIKEEELKPFKLEYWPSIDYGDVTRKKYDAAFIYYLPIKRKAAFKISQGYNGKVSHLDKNAIDFEMPEGSEVHAVRSGTVLQVVQEHEKGCPQPECEEYNNYILIYHEDGTFAEYSHLKKDGALVKKGDNVTQGDHIGYTGKTGYTDSENLHLEIFVKEEGTRRTIKTNFLKGRGGEDYGILSEGQIYRRWYY